MMNYYLHKDLDDTALISNLPKPRSGIKTSIIIPFEFKYSLSTFYHVSRKLFIVFNMAVK